MMGVSFSISGRRGISGTPDGGVYLPPGSETVNIIDVISSNAITKTTDSNGNSLKLRNKVQVIARNITFSGTITSVTLEIRRDSDDAWLTGATDYRRMSVGPAARTDWTTAASIPLTVSTTPTDIEFQVYGLGIALDTSVFIREMTNASNARWSGAMTNAPQLHNGFRIIFTGTGLSITGGTIGYVYY